MEANSIIMVYEKNGATAPYNEAIFKKGGWIIYTPVLPVGIPVSDDLPHVKEFIEGAVETPATRKPSRPPKAKPVEE